MRSILSIVLVVTLSVVAHPAFSNNSLNQHVMAVSQSMSAFYMYSLSEGDDRYKKEYLSYFDVAETHLNAFQNEDAVTANELKGQWTRLRPSLKFDYVDGAGFIIPVAVRNQFRSYLSHAFSKLNQSMGAEVALTNELSFMSLNIEVLSARFFDVSSALYGTMSIANNDNVIDPTAIAKQINLKLSRVATMNLPEAVKKDLRQVKTKWQFIEDTVVNYKDEAAYLLVYFNKSKIHKLLANSQQMMARA